MLAPPTGSAGDRAAAPGSACPAGRDRDRHRFRRRGPAASLRKRQAPGPAARPGTKPTSQARTTAPATDPVAAPLAPRRAHHARDRNEARRLPSFPAPERADPANGPQRRGGTAARLDLRAAGPATTRAPRPAAPPRPRDLPPPQPPARQPPPR